MIQLPTPQEKYDAQNERETRRLIVTELAALRSAIEVLLARINAL